MNVLIWHPVSDLESQRSPNDDPLDRNQALNRLVWNQTEELLRPAAADILEIFDW